MCHRRRGTSYGRYATNVRDSGWCLETLRPDLAARLRRRSPSPAFRNEFRLIIGSDEIVYVIT
ncbi:hypothetical protein [Escherichia phage vB_EcoM_Lh1B]|nr:hypothetical protein [Escherichia phage vB_EcoM_Lh1B]